MIVTTNDRQRYFNGLLKIVSIQKEIVPNEEILLRKIGTLLGFNKNYVDFEIEEFVLSRYINREVPIFSNCNLAEAFLKDGVKLAFAIFALSLIFVFLFLSALYESWSVPFSVLFAIPIGAFGAITALTFIPHLSDNVYAQIGLVALIGLAAKNAILIVEYAKVRVDGGMPLNKTVISAIKLRLSILMTSLAFILGVSPLAFASGAGAQARQTIGWTVIGGMLAATMLAIFIVPVLFVTITKIAYGKEKLAQLEAKGYTEE